MDTKVAVITGASEGIGKATVKYFLEHDWIVHGIDTEPSSISDTVKEIYSMKDNYIHHIADVSHRVELPPITGVNVLINNAGVQTNSLHDIMVNTVGAINCTEVYADQPGIQAVVNIASTSAHNGAEFPYYVASKGGVLAYTVNTSKYLARHYQATCNSLSFGGVTTELNRCVMDDESLWDEIMHMTPLKKWMTAEECAEWIYFIAVMNRSMTGQDIIIDNGEMMNHTFVWK